MLTSHPLANPVNLPGVVGFYPAIRCTEIGVDSACCVIGLEHMRST
jgi:hypothetical protein